MTRDEYRKRVWLCLIGITVLWAIAFGSTFVVFHNVWTLVSMPTVLAACGVLIGIAWVLLLSHHVHAAAWWILLTLGAGFIGLILNDGYGYYAGPHALWLIIAASLLLIDQEWAAMGIILVVLAAYFVVALLQYPHLSQVPITLDPPVDYLVRNTPALFGALISAYLIGYWRRQAKAKDNPQAH